MSGAWAHTVQLGGDSERGFQPLVPVSALVGRALMPCLGCPVSHTCAWEHEAQLRSRMGTDGGRLCHLPGAPKDSSGAGVWPGRPLPRAARVRGTTLRGLLAGGHTGPPSPGREGALDDSQPLAAGALGK